MAMTFREYCQDKIQVHLRVMSDQPRSGRATTREIKHSVTAVNAYATSLGEYLCAKRRNVYYIDLQAIMWVSNEEIRNDYLSLVSVPSTSIG